MPGGLDAAGPPTSTASGEAAGAGDRSHGTRELRILAWCSQLAAKQPTLPLSGHCSCDLRRDPLPAADQRHFYRVYLAIFRLCDPSEKRGFTGLTGRAFPNVSSIDNWHLLHNAVCPRCAACERRRKHNGGAAPVPSPAGELRFECTGGTWPVP